MRYGGDENGANLRTMSYTSNSHNQYTSVDHPGYHHVTGLAGLTGGPPAAPGTIKINTATATLQDSYFFKELQETNGSNPVSVPITLEETPNGGGGPNTTTLGDVYVPRNGVTRTYQNGNLINDGRWIYTWSPGNRLIRMEPTAAASAAHTAAGHTTDLPIIDYLYDWRGRRISRKVTYGTGATDPSVMTSFIYDGWNIVATIEQTYDDWDLQIVRSIWGLDLSGGFQGAGGVGGLLATRTTDMTQSSPGYGVYTNTESERHFPSYDGNGNIIAWTTDDGATTTTRDFDAFGNVVTNQGTRWSTSTPYGFSTKYEEVETGLLYYGYRYYDPVTGRWPSRDPIGERGGINLYGMVGNDCISRSDYLGQFDWMHDLVDAIDDALVRIRDGVLEDLGITEEAEQLGEFLNPLPDEEELDGMLENADELREGDLGAVIPLARDAIPLTRKLKKVPWFRKWFGGGRKKKKGDPKKKKDDDCDKPKKCKPCDPVVGSVYWGVDRPPSPAHNGIPTPHSHMLVVNQSPVKAGCKCFWVRSATPVPGIMAPEWPKNGGPPKGGGVAP